MKRPYSLLFVALIPLFSSFLAFSKEHKLLHLVSTGDVHGSWFSRSYVDDAGVHSLMSVKYYVDSLRNAVGEENVLLLDAGDCLQGNNAAYYFNYVDTLSEHLYPRLVSYMAYDAIVVGNHDIETGHPVYDKVRAQLEARSIPWLGGNAVRLSDSEPYFPVYATFERAGLKVAVLGFTNANMKAWLGEELWYGMDFLSLLPYVQDKVDEVVEKEVPDLTIVVVHSGTGSKDVPALESQGVELLYSLKGVDLLITSHDHRPTIMEHEGLVLLNGGSHARRVGHAVVQVEKEGESLVSKSIEAEIVNMDAGKTDPEMEKFFEADYLKVKEFSNRIIGRLSVDLRSKEAYAGMSNYINMLHTVQLLNSGARISFAAPLSFNAEIKAGELSYNEAFGIYPYENELYVLKLKGSEIKDYLEYSYDAWIQTPGEHVLKIVNRPDPRTGTESWSFSGRAYNFDSAAGLVYTVDVSRPFGQRVEILSLADGSAFESDAYYEVAMTSYRASGGGALITEGTGLTKEEVGKRVLTRYQGIREMVVEFVNSLEEIDASALWNHNILGEWHFVPEETAAQMIAEDLKLIFKSR